MDVSCTTLASWGYAFLHGYRTKERVLDPWSWVLAKVRSSKYVYLSGQRRDRCRGCSRPNSVLKQMRKTFWQAASQRKTSEAKKTVWPS